MELKVILRQFLLLLLTQWTRLHAEKFELQYEVREEIDTPFSFGNLLIDSGLSMRWNRSVQLKVYFNILRSSLTRANVFQVNQQGLLKIVDRLDRDVLCPLSLFCEETLMITSNPAQFSELFQIKIRILDINDQAPEFIASNQSISISEASKVGEVFELPTAVDNDSGPFTVQYYTLVEPSSIFELVWNKEARELKLRLLQQLDRETTHEYFHTIIATDGGIPQLTGTLNLHVNVKDSNDNAPIFNQKIYSKSVPEDLLVKSAILKVNARDADSGLNAKLTYFIRYSASAYVKNTFSMDRDTGILRLKVPLDYESVKSLEIPIEVLDSGPVGNVLSDHALVHLQIEDRNDETPTITIVSHLGGQLIHVMENASVGTPVAYVFVTDNDSGLGGQVDCEIDPENFLLVKIEITQPLSQYRLMTARIYDREITPMLSGRLICRDKGSPHHESSLLFNVTVNDTNDVYPKFLNSNDQPTVYAHTMFENNKVSQPIIQVIAQDTDAGENGRVSYYIQAEYQDIFKVITNGPSGQIFSVKSLDREEQDNYRFLVFAKDHGHPSLTSSATISISVLDENDYTPTFTNVINLEVFENASYGSRIGEIQAIDKDLNEAGQVRYSLQSDQNDSKTTDKFRIDEYGRVFVHGQLDREFMDKYIIYVRATDQSHKPLTGTGTIHVRILDINDNAPKWLYPQRHSQQLNISYSLFTKGHVLSHALLAHDADLGDNSKVSYRITKTTPMALLSINSSSGELKALHTLSEHQIGNYEVHVEAQDAGYPPQINTTVLIICINASELHNTAPLLRRDGMVNFIIIIVIVTVTLLVSCTLVLCIIRLQRISHHNGSAQFLCCGMIPQRGGGPCCTLVEENHALKSAMQLSSDGKLMNQVTTAGSHFSKSQLSLRSTEYAIMPTLPRQHGNMECSSGLRQAYQYGNRLQFQPHAATGDSESDSGHGTEEEFNKRRGNLATTYVSYSQENYQPPTCIYNKNNTVYTELQRVPDSYQENARSKSSLSSPSNSAYYSLKPVQATHLTPVGARSGSLEAILESFNAPSLVHTLQSGPERKGSLAASHLSTSNTKKSNCSKGENVFV